MRLGTRWILTLAIGLVCKASIAQADWEAKALTSNPKVKIDSYIRVKQARVRYDMNHANTEVENPKGKSTVDAGGKSFIIDSKGSKTWMLMPQSKTALEMDLRGSPAQGFLCMYEQGSIDACYQKLGFQKVKEEVSHGHPCVVYKGQIEFMGKKKVYWVWRPKDLPEVSMVRSATFDPKLNGWTQTDIVDIKTAAQGDEYFQVPSDYHVTKMSAQGALENAGAALQGTGKSALKGMFGGLKLPGQ